MTTPNKPTDQPSQQGVTLQDILQEVLDAYNNKDAAMIFDWDAWAVRAEEAISQPTALDQASSGMALSMAKKERDDARMAATMLRTAVANALTDYEDDGDIDALIAELKELV